MVSVEEEFQSMRGALLCLFPFFGSLLFKCRVRYEDIPYPAANDGHKTLIIDKDKFMSCKPRDRLFILAHEAMHLALLSATRRGGRNPMLWNVATDCVINHLLTQNNMTTSLEVIKPAMVSMWTGVKDTIIEKLSAEKIYELLTNSSEKFTVFSKDDIPGCSHDELANGSGDTHQHMDEELEDYWKSAIAEAYNYSKSAGKTPAGVDILIELLKPKVYWRTIFKQAFVHGRGVNVLSTWQRLHRKLPENVPGYIKLSIPNIWVLVDVSGSMVGDSLNQVMSEVFSIARTLNSKVRMIAWDTQAYEASIDEVRRSLKVRGAGGTVIAPALDYLLQHMRNNDCVVILTDGMIFDAVNVDVKDMLSTIAAKSSTAVFATTLSTIDLPERWRTVIIN